MSRLLALLVGSFLASAPLPSATQPLPDVSGGRPAPSPAGDKEVLNRPLTEFDVESVTGRFVARTIAQNPRGENFRLYFDKIAPGDSTPFVVRVVGPDGIMGIMDREKFTKEGQYASDVFAGSEIAVEVEAERKPQGLSFNLVEIAYETPGGAPLSVTIPDQRQRVREGPDSGLGEFQK